MHEENKSNQGVDARVAAARLLNHVLAQHHTVDAALGAVAAKMRLDDDEKRLVHAISGIVFRHLPEIDTILRHIMNRERDPSPVMLHQLLRVGVAQLLWMGVAPHAAVHTTVSAAGSLHLSKQKSLINAVLRSVQRQRDDLLARAPDALAQLPEWLSARWIRHYGPDRAAAIAAAMAREAPIDLGIKDAKASLEWAQLLQGEELLPGAVRVHQRAGHVTSWPGFREGAWWVQDVAASFPINILGDVAGKSVLDVCAAPGGKSMQLAARGASVTAIDIAASRMTRLHDNLQRVSLSGSVETVVADAMAWRTDARFDIVVLDAPCSSTGTLRRHPELPWIHSENSVLKMTVVQHDLMRRAADLLLHEGIMLYCTCSLEVEEGEAQLESFLKDRSDFKDITPKASAVHPYLAPGRGGIGLRTFPDVLHEKGGMDGFFMALLKKI